MPSRLSLKINICIFAALALNLALWAGSSVIFPKWAGVPPVPSANGALMMGLSDTEFAFRLGALTLQNLGDENGQTTSLKEYNYKKLDKWFWLLHDLDPASDHVPLIAAYYFGATMDPGNARIIVNYLGVVGQSPVGNKWRWLAQAVILARHRVKDLDLALDLAYKLSKMEPVGDVLPHWARQMPVFVLTAKGDKDDAKKLIENMLVDSDRFHPNEVNFMKLYLTEQLGVSPEEVDGIMRRRTKPIIEDLPMPGEPVEVK